MCFWSGPLNITCDIHSDSNEYGQRIPQSCITAYGSYHILRNYPATITHRVKSGNFGHQVNSDIHKQTVEIQMRRLLLSRLIRIFTVCLVNLFFIPIIKI